ncbi:hypothetical protein LTR48_006114 [Friedmanniomyces endolithicus]|uniref:Profilin n=1 Tax=Rachicladosporium monterosium TaxID=1507873 RepID=A0ABR0L423_9PEZI|nr:hypothetical protein LTR48_006114 [Friedmanniomyces endolithicus]KAK5143169.1 hypothetical protein LTR32_004647 [Rachicladosporium monterosium]
MLSTSEDTQHHPHNSIPSQQQIKAKMADGSIFAKLDDEEQILTVGMNEVAILEPDDDYVAIGTQNLNGCSGVVVMGRGIIMAHISPYPTARSDNGNSDGRAGMRHFAELLAEVRDLHN